MSDTAAKGLIQSGSYGKKWFGKAISNVALVSLENLLQSLDNSSFESKRKAREAERAAAVPEDTNKAVELEPYVPPSLGPKLIISGAPASGKGSQCEKIVSRYGVTHISSGDILRSAKGELGDKAREYMSTGDLVPDELVVDLVLERLSSPELKATGWLLDGFPRTEAQAKILVEKGLEVDVYLQLLVPDEILTERCVFRRLDPVSGKIYHLKYSPPEDEEIAARLITRADDTAEKIKIRLNHFHENNAAVVDVFKAVVHTVDGNRSADRIFHELSLLIEGKKVPKRLFISGAPGSGKGQQCQKIISAYGVQHVSSGDLVRREISTGSSMGEKAKPYLLSGENVPDDILVPIVISQLSALELGSSGYLLDGFPRTESQAVSLQEAGISPHQVLLVDVPDSKIVEMHSARLIDPLTSTIYHEGSPELNSAAEAEETKEGEPTLRERLVQREDDKPEKVRARLTEYHESTVGVANVFSSKIRVVNGAQSADKNENAAKVFEQVKKHIEGEFVPKTLIISGAPASGKGAQCEFIMEKYGVVHVFVADLLRQQSNIEGSEDAATIKDSMANGTPLPDDFLTKLVLERLNSEDCQQKGYLLDGFPRNANQAQMLRDAMGVPQAFLMLDIDIQELVMRCSKRRMDPQSGEMYDMVEKIPDDEEITARLVQREDDNEEIVRARMQEWRDETEPVAEYYKEVLRKIDSSRPKAVINTHIESVVGPPPTSV